MDIKYKTVKCPYCSSENIGKIELPVNKTFLLLVTDLDSNAPPTEGRKVDAYGCPDCGFMALRNLDLHPVSK